MVILCKSWTLHATWHWGILIIQILVHKPGGINEAKHTVYLGHPMKARLSKLVHACRCVERSVVTIYGRVGTRRWIVDELCDLALDEFPGEIIQLQTAAWQSLWIGPYWMPICLQVSLSCRDQLLRLRVLEGRFSWAAV